MIGRTRASAGAAPCAAWFGPRCVGGRCGGYGREGYRGLHLGLGEELALLHGVDPEDEVILTCTTRDRARAQQRPSLSAQSQVGGGALGRWSRSSAFGGKGLPSRNLCRQVTSAASRSSGQKSNSVLMDILSSRG